MGISQGVNRILASPCVFLLTDSRYNTAKKIKEAQDSYCERALNDEWEGLGDFPQELVWEALVDVLRGRVKVLDIVLDSLALVKPLFR